MRLSHNFYYFYLVGGHVRQDERCVRLSRDVDLLDVQFIYKVVKEGKGEKFKKTDRIMVKYAGRHLNGEEFDSSKGEAVPFNPAQVVPGFGEMLLLMNPGAVYTIYIPAELAYGLNGQAPVIEPNEMLIFEVETVGLEK